MSEFVSLQQEGEEPWGKRKSAQGEKLMTGEPSSEPEWLVVPPILTGRSDGSQGQQPTSARGGSARGERVRGHEQATVKNLTHL